MNSFIEQDISLEKCPALVLNADYRDYLNRMRFYSAEIGRNFQIQVKLKY